MLDILTSKFLCKNRKFDCFNMFRQISGKCIVRQGDTFNTTYFIHQGEVEKWMTDAK